jgi:DNA-binding CsgD family transcriptional regulator
MKKIFLLIGGSALLLVSLIVGGAFAVHSAFAQSTSPAATPATTTTTNATNYCDQYQQDLAKRLGVSVSTLQSDRKSAFADTLAQLVKDGKLSQNQANQIQQRVESSKACSGFSATGIQNRLRAQFLAQYRSQFTAQVAQGLHLTSSQLTTQLKSGKTLRAIAKGQNVSPASLKTIIVNAAKSTLNQAVSSGDITQAQAASFGTYLQNHPARLLIFLQHQARQPKA